MAITINYKFTINNNFTDDWHTRLINALLYNYHYSHVAYVRECHEQLTSFMKMKRDLLQHKISLLRIVNDVKS